MIENINANRIREFLENCSVQQVGPARSPLRDPADASLNADYAALIEKAEKQQDDDADAVQKARELLFSGRLETRKNMRAAAQNIADCGT